MRSEVSRPIMVSALSIVLGAAAVLNILVLSVSKLDLLGAASREAVAGLSSFDLATLYALFAVQLTSMVLFFRLRGRAVSWFGAYVGIASLMAFGYTLAPDPPRFFNEVVALAGLSLALGVFAYMRQLRRRRVLI
ncbi:MAG TPA: hypothetical protein VFX89_08535 [Gammaproteobacteria bacterium]|nr:hypothetical protein [Gammaproteobacteria bacterium]